MDQYQRKDSVSSEVAALLCISGRTSRISSVGSQGSAASRLSAISGLSRSPSPHKMILETSFCGPKPLEMPLDSVLAPGAKPSDALEQLLLARKHDPTQAVLAEGITIKPMPKEGGVKDKNGAAGKTVTARRAKPVPPVVAPEVKITKPQVIPKASAMEHKKIVGKTENGTEYIRIKLKPDHFYDDQGLAANERVVDEVNADIAARKPASLSIQKAPKAEPKRSTASPKPSKHIFGSGSRSPSPATVTTSRKNSFCSLFKSKETSNAPDSPTSVQNRKKSSASARENDDTNSHRSRSCGKIKDMGDRLSPSPTPSKQKSVLGLFKTKRSGSASKSKSGSPVDHEDRRLEGSISPIVPNNAASQTASGGAKPRLRYYDADKDHSGIFIPLHTPPEEKDLNPEDDAVARYNQMLDKQLHETELGRSILRSMNKPIRSSESETGITVAPEPKVEIHVDKQDEITPAPKITSAQAKKSVDPQVPKIRKSSRIEYPDGSIRIPLRSPSDEDPPAESQVYEVQVQCEPQPAAVSVKPEVNIQIEVEDEPKSKSSSSMPHPVDVPVESQVHCVEESHSKNFKVDMVPLPQSVPDQQIEELPQPQPPPPTPASVSSNGGQEQTREKKHILFTTKIGSGEEQLFQTQFSVSKTESLCSPTSDANNAHSDNASNLSEDKDRKGSGSERDKVLSHEPSTDDKIVEEYPADPAVTGSPSVIVQMPQSVLTRRTSNQVLRCAFSTDEEMSLKESTKAPANPEPAEEVVTAVVVESKPRSTDAMDYKLGPQRTSTTEENAMISSGSDRDSETCTDTTTRSKAHLPHNLAIDEHESTGLVSQISYEDELPYVPTTLPEERSVGVPIIPIKERATMEVKTYPVERPRSTTPLNPSFIDDYCGADVDTPTSQRGEKLKICLPRKDSRDKILQKPKSPRRVSNSSGKSWFEYEARGEPTDQFEEPPPPPLPPRATATSMAAGVATANNHSQWVNFENIPEKRKPPKRITTVPHKDSTMIGTGECATTVYQFVKPDECQCECHENERKVGGPETPPHATASDPITEEAQPLLGSDSNGLAGPSAGEGSNSMR